EYLERLFLKRNTYYQHLDRQAILFDDPEIDGRPSKQTLTVDKKIRLSFDQLDFRYGAISFDYKVHEMDTDLEFEIENEEVRPEFDVLKPYFSKVLNSKYVEVEIFAEFENEQLVSQTASSKDLEKINREIIDSVKLRFVSQGIFDKRY